MAVGFAIAYACGKLDEDDAPAEQEDPPGEDETLTLTFYNVVDGQMVKVGEIGGVIDGGPARILIGSDPADPGNLTVIFGSDCYGVNLNGGGGMEATAPAGDVN